MIIELKKIRENSPRWDLNPRPADYKSAALPLSHGGENIEFFYSIFYMKIL